MKCGRLLTAVMIIFALIVAPLGAYVSGYFFLSERVRVPGMTPSGPMLDGTEQIFRFFPREWQASMFRPAGLIEEWFTGCDVKLWGDAPLRIKTVIEDIERKHNSPS